MLNLGITMGFVVGFIDCITGFDGKGSFAVMVLQVQKLQGLLSLKFGLN